MIFVDTIGGNKKQRELVNDVAYWCVNKLMPRMKKLDIEIQINNLKNNAVGYCMMQDDNRTYEIEVDKKLDIEEMIVTVCHEMVHVKQYARNELGINDKNDGQNYFDLPYEKEAYELQEILLKQYQEDSNASRI
tara:strand:- start:1304 stop:1705 length:402 start_codon:yes stop_codon:yes gene_type:complete